MCLPLVLAIVLVNQDISVSGLAICHIYNCIVGILERPLLHPRLDLLVDSKLQHVLDLGRRADGAATDLDAVANQGEGIDVRKQATIRSTVTVSMGFSLFLLGEYVITYPTWINVPFVLSNIR